jgi:hypothetical protein
LPVPPPLPERPALAEPPAHRAAGPPGLDDEPISGRAGSPFGAVDPAARARRLARALVSDIVVYNPERRDRSLKAGTIRQEFREEIRKSWDEYVAQVGNDVARETPFFREALNEILAGGAQLF